MTISEVLEELKRVDPEAYEALVQYLALAPEDVRRSYMAHVPRLGI
jgi:hypothetical protein